MTRVAKFCCHDGSTHTTNRVHTLNGLVVRVLKDRHTDAHTDGTVSITSTADAGGNKSFCLQYSVTLVAHHLVAQLVAHQ